MSDADPVLDLAFLDALAVDIGADGVAEAVSVFLQDAEARLERWRRANVALRQEAHALSGSARAVGLVRLGNTASAVQRALDAGMPTVAAARRLEELLREGVAALEAWLKAQRALGLVECPSAVAG